MMRLCLLLLCFWMVVPVKGQKKIYRTEALDPLIQTLQVRVENAPLYPPIISLRGDDRIIVSFDQFVDDPQYLSYSVIHCNADWTRSSLSELEYLDGFNNRPVEYSEMSLSTYRNYIHYKIVLPNESMRFKVSGNYVVIVYPEDEPDRILLHACFSISSDQVSVPCRILTKTDIDYNKAHQQIEFNVQYPHYDIRSPQTELKIYVSQNNRRDNEVIITHTLYVKSRELVYAHNKDLIFEAGNEYRRFEMVTTKYKGMRVSELRYYDPYFNVTLFPDFPRAGKNYLYDQTQNGRFTIRESDAVDSDLEADYFIVHFSLDYDKPLSDGNIYLEGEFTYDLFNDRSQMIYNPDTRRYEKTLFLKQGAYNYQYLYLPFGQTKATPSLIEGNYVDTKNEYLIKVYHRVQGERYDRLIGIGRCIL